MFQNTPLSDACLHQDFQLVRSLLRDELATRSIFIKGSSQDSLICTLPYSCKPPSSIIQYKAVIPVEEKDEEFIEEIDASLVHFFSQLGNAGGIGAIGKNRFNVGDLVKLIHGRRCSSDLSLGVSQIEQSEVGVSQSLLIIPL